MTPRARARLAAALLRAPLHAAEGVEIVWSLFEKVRGHTHASLLIDPCARAPAVAAESGAPSCPWASLSLCLSLSVSWVTCPAAQGENHFTSLFLSFPLSGSLSVAGAQNKENRITENEVRNTAISFYQQRRNLALTVHAMRCLTLSIQVRVYIWWRNLWQAYDHIRACRGVPGTGVPGMRQGVSGICVCLGALAGPERS